jgi:hypothetical protein
MGVVFGVSVPENPRNEQETKLGPFQAQEQLLARMEPFHTGCFRETLSYIAYGTVKAPADHFETTPNGGWLGNI